MPRTEKQAKAARADIYRGTELIGRLARTKTGSVFEYNATFLERVDLKREQGAAYRLPYARIKTETTGVNLHPFFAGLLPEGLRLKALIRKVKTSEDDLLSLLISSGADCIGDIFVLPQGEMPGVSTAVADIRKLEEVVFADLFKQSVSPEGTLDHITIPGIQDKISASMASFPIRAKKCGSSYILKLTPTERPKIVENEFFFLQMAKACGLKVNEAEIVHDKRGASGLLVRRFDRVPEPVHQEDACQFLDRYPGDKYLVSFSEIAEGLELCSTPILEVAKLIRLKAYSYLIANGDLHAKNVSLFTSPKTGRIELTPAYDLLSTLPYGDLKMALKFEGRDDNLKRKYFVEFGKRHGVKDAATHAILDEIIDAAGEWVDRLEEIGLGEKKTAHLRQVMLKRRGDLGNV